jgi:hypothetical protein
MKRVVIGLAVVAGAAFLLWPDVATLPPEQQQTRNPNAVQSSDPSPAKETLAADETVSIGRFPLTLRQGTLLPTSNVTALFNAWLAESQARRYEDWKPEMLTQASTLPPGAREQLEKWLDQYVELNLAMQMMMVNGEPTWDNILDKVRKARGDYFGEEEGGLFSDQIALENFTESVVNTFEDGGNPLSNLVDMEQQAATLPPPARQQAEAMLKQLSQSLQQDPSLNENSAEWNRLVQSSAAATLETPSVDLTEASASFLQRYNAYAAERETLQQQGASEEQLKALRATHFSGPELLRAGTMDKALAE